MTTTYRACNLSNPGQTKPAVVQGAIALALPGGAGQAISKDRASKEELRHILLGSPSAIRQTIHLLHRLQYSEPALWTPLSPVRGQLVITSEQGEMMSLLRRSL